jgi:poly(3-hydroxybutyrate) depolymerase
MMALLMGLTLLAAGVDAAEPEVKIEGPVDDAAKGVKVFKVDSPYLGRASTVEVLLPDKLEEGRTYRTLYVLPVEGGIGGQYGDGLAEVRKADAHNRYGLICVTMSFDSVPWYGAHATNPRIRHEEFIKRVVVPLVESRFPASGKPAGRLLIGFSKSGWGAISLLLRDPAFFGAACSWDAPLMMTEAKLGYASKHHFGTPEQAAPYVPVNLVKQRAAELAKGPPRLTILGKNTFGGDTRKFHELLDAHGVPHRYDNELTFKHHWESGWVPKALEIFLAPAAATQPPAEPPATRPVAEESPEPTTQGAARSAAKEDSDPDYPKVDAARVPLILAMESGIATEPTKLPWRLYVPPQAGADNKLPLLFFLHGAGRRGDDNVGPMDLAHEFWRPEAQKKHPCLVLAPQCRRGAMWTKMNKERTNFEADEQPVPEMAAALAALDSVLEKYPVDRKRVYVTGQSIGGFGAWDALYRRPGLWAAAVPVCGGGDPDKAALYKDVPLWAWHGANDTAVPPECSRQMIAALKAAGGNPKYTELPRVGHGSWRPTYESAELHEWLFAQKRD